MSNAAGAAWITSAAIVSTLALLFTIGSFWWLNARQGKLRSFEPHSFAGSITPQSTSIRLPTVFFNTGPKPIVVQNMRLAFPEDPGVTFALPWRNSRKQFRPETGDFKDFPAVFSVDGRSVVEVFADFGAPFASAAPKLRDQKVRLEVKLGHEKEWRNVLDFTLRLSRVSDPEVYIAYSNDPDLVSPDDLEKAGRALKTLVDDVLADNNVSPDITSAEGRGDKL